MHTHFLCPCELVNHWTAVSWALCVSAFLGWVTLIPFINTHYTQTCAHVTEPCPQHSMHPLHAHQFISYRHNWIPAQLYIYRVFFHYAAHTHSPTHCPHWQRADQTAWPKLSVSGHTAEYQSSWDGEPTVVLERQTLLSHVTTEEEQIGHKVSHTLSALLCFCCKLPVMYSCVWPSTGDPLNYILATQEESICLFLWNYSCKLILLYKDNLNNIHQCSITVLLFTGLKFKD